MKTRKFIPLLVIAAGLLAYHNSFHAAFILDDIKWIVDGARIRHIWRLWEILAHTSRPVVDLTLAVNYAWSGLDPWGYHLVNVGVHILAALALYGVVRLAFVSEPLRSRFGEAAPQLAAVISVIWLVHPLQTESVTYTIQRSESLMGLFYLLALYCVIRSNGASRNIWWQVGAVASCALGMASKPVMVTAPVVIVLYDRAFLAKSWREVMERRGTLYGCLAATWSLLPLLLANAPSAEWSESAGFGYKDIRPLQYALIQPGVILHYLRLAFWPHPLCFDYGWQYGWPATGKGAEALLAVAVVGGLLTATLWACWRKPALGFVGAWFFIILSPTSSFVPIADLVVEHRMYLPLAGVVAMTVVGAFLFGKLLFSKRQGGVLAWLAGVSVVLLLETLTIQRNYKYNSVFTIWQDTVAVCPNNPRAHNNLGVALVQLGRLQEATVQLEQALRIKPDFAEAHNNLGLIPWQLGKAQEAIGHYEEALRIRPNYAEAHNNLGVALVHLGKVQEGIWHYEQALRLKPDYANAHYNLGLALWQTGQVPDAIEQWEQALRIKPDYAEAHYNLGVALGQAGRLKDAIGHYEQAVRIKPDYADAHNNLGVALEQAGRLQDAIGHYEQALRIKPDYADAHYNLGAALEQAGRLQEAIRHYEQALRLDPRFTQAKENLARLRAAK